MFCCEMLFFRNIPYLRISMGCLLILQRHLSWGSIRSKIFAKILDDQKLIEKKDELSKIILRKIQRSHNTNDHRNKWKPSLGDNQ